MLETLTEEYQETKDTDFNVSGDNIGLYPEPSPFRGQFICLNFPSPEIGNFHREELRSNINQLKGRAKQLSCTLLYRTHDVTYLLYINPQVSTSLNTFVLNGCDERYFLYLTVLGKCYLSLLINSFDL